MRVAVTDYDGTLAHGAAVGGTVEASVLEAIRDWQNAGNVFGIATGRNRAMVCYEIERFAIPFDFLVCCNGAMLYDANLKIISNTLIPDAIVRDVLEHPAAKDSMHFDMCSGGDNYLYMPEPDSWFPGLGTPYTEITLPQALVMTGLEQISFSYHIASESVQYAEMLNAEFGDTLIAHRNGSCIDIVCKGINKAKGIEELLAKQGWPEAGILVIGDGNNDLPMIERFCGFTVKSAHAEVKLKARTVYNDVGAMLRAHEKT